MTYERDPFWWVARTNFKMQANPTLTCTIDKQINLI